MEGICIELMPHIKKMIELEDLLIQTHEDMSKGGIYMAKEFQLWKELLELGDYQEAVMKIVRLTPTILSKTYKIYRA